MTADLSVERAPSIISDAAVPRRVDLHIKPALPGQALLAKGGYPGAIAKFENGQRKNPHFVDPLEMWGEALCYVRHGDETRTQCRVASTLGLSVADRAGLPNIFAVSRHVCFWRVADVTVSNKPATPALTNCC